MLVKTPSFLSVVVASEVPGDRRGRAIEQRIFVPQGAYGQRAIRIQFAYVILKVFEITDIGFEAKTTINIFGDTIFDGLTR